MFRHPRTGEVIPEWMVTAEAIDGFTTALKEEDTEEKEAVSPPGWEDTVVKMKDHPEITNPWALSWWMKGKGYKPKGASKKEALEVELEFDLEDPELVKRLMEEFHKENPEVVAATTETLGGEPEAIQEVKEGETV